ncbi:DNA-3-methyladenine glycosylase [Paenibacillus sp. BR2-3]|uniref:DNA-3-methyladenine glycosylase n=1 Tax=Paenibacillus sp. BR2-3 TaxID=3048494 RepID=UPI003977334C
MRYHETNPRWVNNPRLAERWYTAMDVDNNAHSNHSAKSRLLLPGKIYEYTALQAAPRLLGQHLVRRTEDGDIVCRIVETESYGGAEDKGSHAYGGRRTARTEIMFNAGGAAYVYLIYGMYHCLNVVTAGKERFSYGQLEDSLLKR